MRGKGAYVWGRWGRCVDVRKGWSLISLFFNKNASIFMMTVAPRIGLFHSVFSFLSYLLFCGARHDHDSPSAAKFSSKVKISLCEFETWLWA